MMKASNAFEIRDPQAVLAANKVFRHIAPETLKEIAVTATIDRYKVRTLLVKHGTFPTEFRYIIAGGLQVSLATLDGREARLPPDRPGEWAPWPGCFLNVPMAHDIWCLPSSTFLTLPMTVVRSAIFNCPRAMQETLEIVSALSRNLVAWNLSANLLDGEKRLAQLLVYLSNPPSDGPREEAEAQVSQEELGQIGFGSRQLVARLLRRLEARGLLELSYRTVRIVSRAKLREFALSEI